MIQSLTHVLFYGLATFNAIVVGFLLYRFVGIYDPVVDGTRILFPLAMFVIWGSLNVWAAWRAAR